MTDQELPKSETAASASHSPTAAASRPADTVAGNGSSENRRKTWAPMESMRAITTVFLTIGLSALASALVRLDTITPQQWAFASFFMIFRLKMFLDDLGYFKKQPARDFWFQLGFIAGVVSWFFWLMSAMLVRDLRLVLPYMITATAISTAWVVIEGIRERQHPCQHIVWFIVNLVIGVPLVLAYWQHWTVESLGYLFMTLSVAVVIDGIISGSLQALETV